MLIAVIISAQNNLHVFAKDWVRLRNNGIDKLITAQATRNPKELADDLKNVGIVRRSSPSF
jgi:endonuclease III